jgi:UDPglucose 6-dehydrogenase
MHTSVLGSGYVGATLAVCLADLGHDVTAVDIDSTIVERLNAGDPPIAEPGLDDLYAEHVGDQLRTTADCDAILDTNVTFLMMQTPAREDGSIDLSVVLAAAERLGETLAAKKSTTSS